MDNHHKKKSDKFIIRWPHSAAPPLLTADQGTAVRPVNFFKEFAHTTFDGKMTLENIVQVKVGKFGRLGYISASYLQLEADTLPSGDVAKQIVSCYPFKQRIFDGRWFMGRCSQLDCAIWLCNRSALPRGSFLVCQPPSFYPLTRGIWPTFVLVVRLLSGSVESFFHEWIIDENYNARFAGKDGYLPRATKYERLPPPPNEPPPVIAYLTISRTADGRYYLLDDTKTFYLLPELLVYYSDNPFVVDKTPLNLVLSDELETEIYGTDGQIVLQREPVHSRCPRPPPYPMKCPELRFQDLYVNPKAWKITAPGVLRVGKDPLTTVNNPVSASGSVKRGYMRIEGVWTRITFRKLGNLFNDNAFAEDMKLISRETRKTDEKLTEKQRNGYQMNGSEYIAHFLAYDVQDRTYGPWIGMEYVPGIPLDKLLEKRKSDGELFPLRQRYEMMAQVAAGMYWLEANALCHRHLSARNVIVQTESHHLFRVKITDYMIPYHFLNKSNVREVDLTKLEFLWWAPECFDRCFDIVTDVWAFGCLMFEIMNDGLPPYTFETPAIKRPEHLKKFLDDGKTMKLTDDEEIETFVHDVIARCLVKKQKRPQFEMLHTFFTDLLFDFTKSPQHVISEMAKTLEVGVVKKRKDPDDDLAE